MRSGQSLSPALMLSLLLLSLSCLVSTAGVIRADGSRPPSQGTLYLGQGQMLETAKPRQLTLGANAYQFSYQPGGLELACVGEQQDGDALTWNVQLVGVRHGHLATLISETFHLGQDGQPIEPNVPTLITLGGWSGDGRFLLTQKSQFVPSQKPAFKGDSHIITSYTVVDVGTVPYHLALVPLPDSHPVEADTVFWWSPNRSRLLFAAQGVFGDRPKCYVSDTFCTVYDPAQDRLTPVLLNDGQFAVGWLDEMHLMLKQTKGGTTHFFTDDLTTGRQTEIPPPAKLPPGMGEADTLQATSRMSPKVTNLTLQDESRLLTDPQQVTMQHAHALWVRRTLGNKAQSALPIGLTPGQDDPQARWSPDGMQIAFIAHGDLFVTDLSVRQATPEEELGAREPVNCAEERIRAGANLKQIGLAILQYAQDHDEEFPTEDGLTQKLSPYLTGTSFYTVGGHPFRYHGPINLAVGNMTDPAATVLGTMDLPCATVTLYADGHVKDIAK